MSTGVRGREPAETLAPEAPPQGGGPPAPRRVLTQLSRRLARGLLVAPSGLLLALVAFVPLALLIYFGLLTGPRVDGPVTGAEWVRMAGQPELYGRLLVRSLSIGLEATALTVLIGLPTAWALSRHVARKSLFLALLLIPLLTSNLLLIYAMFVLVGPGGPLMATLSGLGLTESGESILFTRWAVLLMVTYLHIPLMTVALFAALERIDGSLLDAARSLGAGPLQRLRHIVLPLVTPGFMAGLVIVFTPVAGSFVEAAILGGTDGMMFGTLIESQLSSVNNQPRAAAMSLALLMSIVVILALLRGLAKYSFPGAMRRRA